MVDYFLEQIFGDSLFESIFNTLNKNLFGGGEYATASNFAENLYTSVVMPVALMLLCIYFLIALVDKFSSENFTWEQMVRQMCMFLVGFYLIDKGFDLLKLLFDLGLSFLQDVGAPGSEGSVSASASVIEQFKKEKFHSVKIISDVLKVCYLMVPWLLTWILKLCVKIICYTRLIEIYVRASFAPIAFSDFFHNGFQGAGWRFLKSFLAVCLQGAVILCIAKIYVALGPVVFNPDGANLFSVIGRYLAILAATCMLLFKSLSLTKEFLGVN